MSAYSEFFKDIPVELIFWFLLWRYLVFQNPLFLLGKCPIFLVLIRRLIQYHILRVTLLVYLENGYFVKLWLQSRSTKKSIKGGVKNPLLYFVFLVCKSSNIPVVYCNRVIFIKQMMIYRYMQLLMLFNVFDFCYF